MSLNNRTTEGDIVALVQIRQRALHMVCTAAVIIHQEGVVIGGKPTRIGKDVVRYMHVWLAFLGWHAFDQMHAAEAACQTTTVTDVTVIQDGDLSALA